METLSKQEIAKLVGADPASVRGCQDWHPDTHPELIFSELVLNGEDGESEVIAFRVKNRVTGEVVSKLPEEQLVLGGDYAAKVDAEYAAAMKHQVVKNGHIIPALFEKHPEFERPNPPALPKFRVVSGVLHVDAAHMSLAHQTSVSHIIAKHPVVAARIKG